MSRLHGRRLVNHHREMPLLSAETGNFGLFQPLRPKVS
jgi:hypothetical protein